MPKKNKFVTSTLEYYNYGEYNKMEPVAGGSCYSVKVSDKDGNIITIEKDNALYAMVSLSFNKNDGILRMLDVAHNDAILAEIEMPNADYIFNCREICRIGLDKIKIAYGAEPCEIPVASNAREVVEYGQLFSPPDDLRCDV